MIELAYGDIVQQYRRNLVLYRGTPVRVEQVDKDKKVTILDVTTQELSVVPFSLEHFKAHKTRLGMMNVHNTVVYVTRIPVRKMQIGLNSENISVAFLEYQYKISKIILSESVRGLGVKEFANLIEGKYPPFDKAIEMAGITKDVCAFDRQFAVSHKGDVFYKTRRVGSLADKTSTRDIVFAEAYQHLSILLENNHEKTVGIACTA